MHTHTQSTPNAGALAAKRARGNGDEDHTADQVSVPRDDGCCNAASDGQRCPIADLTQTDP
jgi:hypothetical protein